MNIALHDPRPDDIAELARLTAIELRKFGRGLHAMQCEGSEYAIRVLKPYDAPYESAWRFYSLYDSKFDNLGPIGCADVIQAEEAKRAQEWAGDRPTDP